MKKRQRGERNGKERRREREEWKEGESIVRKERVGEGMESETNSERGRGDGGNWELRDRRGGRETRERGRGEEERWRRRERGGERGRRLIQGQTL